MSEKEEKVVKKVEHVSYLEKIHMETEITFDVLVIKPGSIKKVSWLDPNYAYNLIKLDLFETVSVNSDSFLEMLGTKLEINKYKIDNPYVKNEIIGEEKNYLYELMYIDMMKEEAYNKVENINEMASLININGDTIYSNAILFRNHIPSLTDSMNLCSVSKNDLARLLYDRVHTKIVIWDDKFNEDIVVGDLNDYAKSFFDDDKFEKFECAFLMHNINIWYQVSEEKQNHMKEGICGNLINKPIEKCIIFSMKSDEFRCNLSLDEVNKIIFLSNKLNDYITPEELVKERIDKLGRKIIFNKYKVLDYMFDKEYLLK